MTHRLSNRRPATKLADCSVCGPDTTIYVASTWMQCAVKKAEGLKKFNANRPPHPRTDARRRSELKSYCKRYGITLEVWDRLLEEQGGVCAICGGVERGYRLHIDHCHTTGKVRGLLCGGCNRGLGQFKDDAARLSSAVAYLKAAGQKPRRVLRKPSPR